MAKPFIKWVGGKSRVLSIFNECLPVEMSQGRIDCYVEPFVGGGAMYFNLMDKYSSFLNQNIILNDSNLTLMTAYLCVKKKHSSLLYLLEQLEQAYNSKKRNV